MNHRLKWTDAMQHVERVVQYKCKICGSRYNTIDAATKCAQRGFGREYPIGCIYGDHRPEAFYEKITFAVAKNRVEIGTMMGHMNNGLSWACRDGVGYGVHDSLGENMCSGNSLYLNKNKCHVDPSTSHFQRMIKYLRDSQIEITVWDGEKPVTYATFMKRFRDGTWGYKENNSLHKEDLLT